METSSSIAPDAATTTFTATNPETDIHRHVRLAFGEMQKYPNLKLRNNV
jgi:hypothetical protein